MYETQFLSNAIPCFNLWLIRLNSPPYLSHWTTFLNHITLFKIPQIWPGNWINSVKTFINKECTNLYLKNLQCGCYVGLHSLKWSQIKNQMSVDKLAGSIPGHKVFTTRANVFMSLRASRHSTSCCTFSLPKPEIDQLNLTAGAAECLLCYFPAVMAGYALYRCK